MFKLIFKFITITIFLVFMTIGLVVWRGGEPFKWLGKNIVIIGESVTDFGDFVDDVVAGSKKLKDVIDTDK